MIAAATVPRIPYIQGRRLADCVEGFDCAASGLYPLPEPELEPELEP